LILKRSSIAEYLTYIRFSQDLVLRLLKLTAFRLNLFVCLPGLSTTSLLYSASIDSPALPFNTPVFLPHLTTAEVVTIRNGNKLPAERQRREVAGVGRVSKVREKASLSATERSFKDVAHVQQQQRNIALQVASCQLAVHRHNNLPFCASNAN